MHKSYDKLINTRNAVIAVIIMLILLLSLQAPICCDGVVTTELTLPAPVEQPQRPAQLPPAPEKKPVSHPVDETVATKQEPAIIIAAAEVRKKETSKPAIVAVITEPEINLSTIAPSAGPKTD